MKFLFLNFAGRYFDEISQDTGRYCFGVLDTLRALEMGAVDTLIVWENLDITRYVLKNHSTDGMKQYIFEHNPIKHAIQAKKHFIEMF